MELGRILLSIPFSVHWSQTKTLFHHLLHSWEYRFEPLSLAPQALNFKKDSLMIFVCSQS